MVDIYSCAYNRLWNDLTEAILNKDMERATIAKSSVEDAQREERKRREENGVQYVPRFFEKVDGHWLPKLKCVSLFFSFFFHIRTS